MWVCDAGGGGERLRVSLDGDAGARWEGLAGRKMRATGSVEVKKGRMGLRGYR